VERLIRLFVSTKQRIGHQSTHWRDTFISELLPRGPQRGCEIINIGDTARAHDMIEEGNIEGDAGIQSVVSALERQRLGKDVARDGGRDKRNWGMDGRFG